MRDENRLSLSRRINNLAAFVTCDSGHFVVTYSALLSSGVRASSYKHSGHHC